MNNILPTPAENAPSHRFCVAPMMAYTDRHCRYLMRLLSRRALLYTEMVTATALNRGPPLHRMLDFDPAEHPVALQLGGSSPHELALATRAAINRGYDEVNLNVGCPSNRVTTGRFGACLMAEPTVVADCVKAMCDTLSAPITVKTRIGIDHLDEDHHLDSLVETAAEAGCDTFIVHARKAWLKGLSPRQNREIPPLDYDRVFRLKRSFPDLEIILNGGLQSLRAAQAVLTPNGDMPLDGVMLGRSIYAAPYLLADVDHLFYSGEANSSARCEIVAKYLDYASAMVHCGARLHHIFRHMVGLYHGCPGARIWRQAVTRVGQGNDDPADLCKLAQSLDTDLSLAA